MKEDYQKALELFFAYGYGCNVFKHDICEDQPKVPDGMPDSSNFRPLKFFASPRCSHVRASSKDTAARVHRREVAEKFERSAPIGDLNGTS